MLYRYISAALATGALLGASMPVQSGDLQTREVRDLTLWPVNPDYWKETSTYIMYAVQTIPTATSTLAINPAIYVKGVKFRKEGTGYVAHNADIDNGTGCSGWKQQDGTLGYNRDPNGSLLSGFSTFGVHLDMEVMVARLCVHSTMATPLRNPASAAILPVNGCKRRTVVSLLLLRIRYVLLDSVNKGVLTDSVDLQLFQIAAYA
jgi:hypothetical protein